mmetsp:Transcript_19686/g.49653  ORF Transcript_19686/g.49653 Transcript_19686/m.49653 type:complete len:247 (-) Transcript_19686:1825-2565(-)
MLLLCGPHHDGLALGVDTRHDHLHGARVAVAQRVDEVDVEQLAAQRALLLGLGRRAVVVERVLHRLPIGAHLADERVGRAPLAALGLLLVERDRVVAALGDRLLLAREAVHVVGRAEAHEEVEAVAAAHARLVPHHVAAHQLGRARGLEQERAQVGVPAAEDGVKQPAQLVVGHLAAVARRRGRRAATAGRLLRRATAQVALGRAAAGRHQGLLLLEVGLLVLVVERVLPQHLHRHLVDVVKVAVG